MNASTVSRQLKAAGFITSAPETRNRREGLFVSGRGTSVSVSVDIPSRPAHQARIAKDVTEALTALGYTVTSIDADGTLLRVEKNTEKEGKA